MKHLINRKNYFIFEAAKQLDSNIDVFIVDTNGLKSLILYNKYDMKTTGFIGMEKLNNGNWQAKFTVAEHGYGPIMYDYAMMSIYPNKLCPSRWASSIHDIGVWKYYFDNRKDINKFEMKDDDKNHIIAYDQGLEYLNYYYQLEPNEEYHNKIMSSKKPFSDKTLFSNGKKLFNRMYDDY